MSSASLQSNCLTLGISNAVLRCKEIQHLRYVTEHKTTRVAQAKRTHLLPHRAVAWPASRHPARRIYRWGGPAGHPPHITAHMREIFRLLSRFSASLSPTDISFSTVNSETQLPWSTSRHRRSSRSCSATFVSRRRGSQCGEGRSLPWVTAVRKGQAPISSQHTGVP